MCTLRHALLLMLALCLVLPACESDDGSSGGDDVTDLRTPLPEEKAGYTYFVGGEAVIEPGKDKMICFHMSYDGPTIAAGSVDVKQSKYGHHAVLVSTTDPKPDGTVEDCTDQKDMYKYSAFLIPMDTLPDGMGQEIKKGTHIVLQSHYINVSKKPIKIRDVIEVKERDHSKIKTWVTTFVTSLLDINVEPGKEAAEHFDCGIDADVDLLLVAGHMHEEGKSWEASIGPDEKSLKTIFDTPNWKPEFRDTPPFKIMMDKPLRMKKGSVLRTSCSWKNTVDHKLAFPEEMCTTFGLIAGTKKHYDCRKEHGKVAWKGGN